LLVLITLLLGSRCTINIPRINTNITVDDTFIFIALMLYGGPAAVVLGAASGIASAIRISKTPRTILFAGGSLACSLYASLVPHLYSARHSPAASQHVRAV
jgi:uncharacterized membrane protein